MSLFFQQLWMSWVFDFILTANGKSHASALGAKQLAQLYSRWVWKVLCGSKLDAITIAFTCSCAWYNPICCIMQIHCNGTLMLCNGRWNAFQNGVQSYAGTGDSNVDWLTHRVLMGNWWPTTSIQLLIQVRYINVYATIQYSCRNVC